MSERTYKLQKGDLVVMHTCMEHDHPDNFGKIWTCRSDEFQHKGHDYGSIFLEGFSGSFSTEFLQKVDVSALVDSLQQQVNGLNEESLANFQTAAERGKQLAERDRTIDLLTKQITDEVGISAKAIAERDMFKTSFEHWNKEAHRVVNENSKLRKALERYHKR